MYGVILEGGGAKGAYHIGAYKAIMDMGIEIGGIAGTSVGALNGAMLVQGEYEKAYELWYNMTYSRVIEANDEKIEKIKNGKMSRSDIKNLAGAIKGVINDGGLDITPLRNLLEEVIDEEKIRNSGKDFGIVTVSLSDLKPVEIYIEDIPKGMLVDYLIASAYFPVFKKEKIDGKKYIDGGVYNNLPINLLSDKGYKDLIAIRTHGVGRAKKFDTKDLNIIYISPNEDLGKTLDFDSETARRDLQLGYYDGIKALRKLKGYKYYIEPKRDEEYFLNTLLNLGEDKILEIGQVLGIENVPYRRALFEFIMPKISEILGTDKENDYEDIVIRFLEILAEKYDIEKFKIYSYDEFLDIVKKQYKEREIKEDNGGILAKVVKKVDFLSALNKDETTLNIADIIF
ncbi:patatin-like phospholipase family protein [Sporanaerobacter acetigenes]|uniref:NTE family protein n=1 Tax=Sporanaerobacter acetigenes DSM 13106 TaxID=1123281 RepID=A0A1M5Y3Q5_9FIRM|nr:patatin-like phospholipase family protein [Sporanaerobacter acetigenes]SHI06691.1 NTE family protein [Sporanaerobacter acetigenes DSM 13106]